MNLFFNKKINTHTNTIKINIRFNRRRRKKIYKYFLRDYNWFLNIVGNMIRYTLASCAEIQVTVLLTTNRITRIFLTLLNLITSYSRDFSISSAFHGISLLDKITPILKLVPPKNQNTTWNVIFVNFFDYENRIWEVDPTL